MKFPVACDEHLRPWMNWAPGDKLADTSDTSDVCVWKLVFYGFCVNSINGLCDWDSGGNALHMQTHHKRTACAWS